MDRKRSVRRSMRRQYKKPLNEKLKDYFRNFIAFMFSNVGIVGLVVGYTIAGAFIFMAIEGESSKQRTYDVIKMRNATAARLWKLTDTTNTLNESFWKSVVKTEMEDYQEHIVNAIRLGYDGADEDSKQWSFSGAFLYSLTVITTIGYGNIAPRTEWGKVTTIIYAIIGMPLFLLYLSNIGDIMARSFKWTYAKCCLCRWCPSVTRRRAERRKRRRRMQLQQLQHNNDHNDDDDDEDEDEDNNDIIGAASVVGRHHRGDHGDGSSEASIESEVQQHFTTTARDDWQRNRNTGNNSITTSSARLERMRRKSIISAGTTDMEDDDDDDDDEDDEEDDSEMENDPQQITVPLTICLAIMVGYVCGGALLFSQWENWDFLDGSYFCFISLSTIGFGDIVPGDKIVRNSQGIELSFIFCSMYLYLGMALIAMCFNLMQEEVIHKIRTVMKTLRYIMGCNR
ncbi:TWiK family of potassium channels protein 18 [Chrysoperla carnea]|uniref:TWiK family of potassium channels protein 18 n=1 Tax=Chrysoperla carnea TaxID=189513 RepID=UPI001D090DC5|nr:TWiK family of potassium channels protein 18 [Chrysoperla carnea]